MYTTINSKLNYDIIKGKFPLQIAFTNGNVEIIKLLLSNPKIDVDSKYIKKEIIGTVNQDEIDYDSANVQIINKKTSVDINVNIDSANVQNLCFAMKKIFRNC